jgi:hypothetical protein
MTWSETLERKLAEKLASASKRNADAVEARAVPKPPPSPKRVRELIEAVAAASFPE